MNARFGVSRAKALAATALAAIAVSTVPGSASATADAHSEHWGVITRNTIGSPVADLRDGPYGSYGKRGNFARPPYGTGSHGISVADHSTSNSAPHEKVDFGNEVDFYGDPVLGLNKVGFHVFQTGENVDHGDPGNLPNIRFEINPNVSAHASDTYSTLVWVPDPVTVTNQWSPYLDATKTGYWYLTGNETACTQAARCNFSQLQFSLNDGGPRPTIYSVAVGKGRDNLWAGAVDGLRINKTIYDFEKDGVKTRRA
ncbi:hypothetical protein ACFRNJ_36010 [Streptomyces sp. NPDC056721]|uniref:hypothetical protein n=1 Tax=Streptomyces sp. NPDC056721 TaxID=3345923 RepID=UPI0036A2F4D6